MCIRDSTSSSSTTGSCASWGSSTMPVKIRMTSSQHDELMRIVFPGDVREAVAIALCGRGSAGDVHVLVVRDVHAAPASAYATRHSGLVSWSTDFLVPLLERAAREHLG